MGMIYKDRVGNRLYTDKRYIYAKNREGKIVNKKGLKTMMRHAQGKGYEFRKYKKGYSKIRRTYIDPFLRGLGSSFPRIRF